MTIGLPASSCVQLALGMPRIRGIGVHGARRARPCHSRRGVSAPSIRPCGQASLAVHTLGRTEVFHIRPITLELADGRDR